MSSKSAEKFFLKIKNVLKMEGVAPPIRRGIIGVVGGTVLLIGLALIVLPGPAFIVIPAGLVILATQFAWARRYLKKARTAIKKAEHKVNHFKETAP